MKKIAVLLLLYFIIYTYSPQVQTGMQRVYKSDPVQQTITSVVDYVSEQGWDQNWEQAWQNTLGTTLQVVSGLRSDNPALEKSMRLLEQHLQLQLNALPAVNPSSLKIQVSPKLNLYAGDTGVTEETLKSASSLITNYSLPIIQSNVKLNPKRMTEIVFYSSPEMYANALLGAGISAQEAAAIVDQTGGITVNSSIWIPLFNLQGKSDLANVLTHELSHVTFNQAGIGTKLPLWLNEGISWHDGLAAQEKISPAQTRLVIKALTSRLKKTAQNGDLLPLSEIDQGLLSASYNVEFQGYLATEQLIEKYGLERFQVFLEQVQSLGVQRSFAQNFGQSLSEFENEFKI
ncbi:hypothetical protein [Desulfitobacterium metallireducens]|uniref:Peptidase MA-like domain-containing protein n=1 Tax=Desulfitobacterium metallireducens DSM 15288 TaxID=871968 RepID=W0EH51_9FIRM|nr:hypothetical protein [Desulfitobacterium metallireducens]AHF08544.1 hypothetical protein DESME_08365 [Desulfitobacterium metallireducens DSM 15288]